ncbi:MAG TPA: hypothetical protein VFT95_16520 [Micromonosporaceae bacterium]|nr:hypothetical protein [Micromonosporaceae bacterium]
MTDTPVTRRDPSSGWLTAALLATVVASLVVLFVPMVRMVEWTPTDGRSEWRSLFSVEGWRSLLIVGMPMLVAAIPLALPRGRRWLGTAMVTSLMSAGVVLGILTIGLFYLPAVILFIVALLRSSSVPA